METGIGTRASAALGLALFAGCALSREVEAGGDIHAGGSTEPLLFSTCPHPLRPGETLECAHVDVPLDWTHPGGDDIELYVGRIRASVPATAQLWLMEGGPGGSSISMLGQADALHRLMPDVDIYAVDHRGVGMSTPLACPGSGTSLSSAQGTIVTPDEIAACGSEIRTTWGAGLSQFSTTNAARDVGEVVARTHVDGQRTILYGVSYGTYWLERYLQLYPSQVDGVVLDSILSPGGSSWPLVASEGADAAARAVLAACGAQASCASHFTGSPESALARGLASLDAGTCAAAHDAGLTADRARTLVATITAEPDLRNMLPAFAERLDACRPSDEHAFTTLASLFVLRGTGDEVSARNYSAMLAWLVTRSELWDGTAERRAEYEAARTRLFAFAVLQPSYETYEAFPHYAPDGYVGHLPDTTIPMLMLQGERDLQTPLAQARLSGDHFTAPHQTFVVFPRGVHDSLQTTGTMAQVTPADTTCAGAMLAQFVRSPTATIDTACAATTTPWAFDDSRSAPFLFGEPSMWGGTAVAEARVALDDARIAEGRERLRARIARGLSP